jgi:hypothetical protein
LMRLVFYIQPKIDPVLPALCGRLPIKMWALVEPQTVYGGSRIHMCTVLCRDAQHHHSSSTV